MKRLLLLLIVVSTVSFVFGEGSKELLPTSSDVAILRVGGTHDTHFAAYGDPEYKRLYVRIDDHTNERVHFGFKYISSGTLYYRIKDASGNIVFGPQAVATSGTGYISNYSRAVAGPAAIVGSSGYTAEVFNPTASGDYYFEFNQSDPSNFDNSTVEIEFFDITVEKISDNSAITGRLHSQNWAFSTGAFTQPFEGAFYVYSSDSIVTRLDPNGFTPFYFSVNCNSYGVTNTGNIESDRKSVTGFTAAPEYPLFLNDPDSTLYPAAVPAVVSSSSPVITGCPGSYCVNVEFTKTGLAQVLLNLDGVPGYQSGTEDVILAEFVFQGENCFNWDGLDGLGNPVLTNTQVVMDVTIRNGYTNFPVYDAECNPNGFIVDLVRPAGVQPVLYWDDSNIGGTVEADGVAAPAHAWATGSCGSSSFGNENTINTYWYGVSDTKAFTIDMPDCPPVAVDDAATIAEDTPTNFNVAANDSDGDGNLDVASVAIISTTSNAASVVPDGAGGLDYTPKAHFNGLDSVVYQICDSTALCDTAVLRITINSVDDPPVAVNDSATTSENTAVLTDVLANDSDPDGPGTIDPTTVSISTGALHGSSSIDPATGVITYTPNAFFSGWDSLSYTVQDVDGLSANVAWLIIEVQAVQVPPVADDELVAVTEDQPIAIDVLDGDTDADGTIDATTVTVIRTPINGTHAVNGTTGEITYTPALNFNGVDTLSYTVDDNDGNTSNEAIVALTISSVNDAPQANDDLATTSEDTPVLIDILANDTDTADVGGAVDPTSVTITTQPTQGTVTIDPATGELTFTPALNFHGADSLTY